MNDKEYSQEETIAKLKMVIRDTIWQAQRYVDGRSTYAVSMFNNAVHTLDAMGLGDLHTGNNGKRFADDGMFGKYNPETRRHERG